MPSLRIFIFLSFFFFLFWVGSTVKQLASEQKPHVVFISCFSCHISLGFFVSSFFFFWLPTVSKTNWNDCWRESSRERERGGGWLFFVERVLLKVAHGCARSIRIWKFPVAGGGRRIQIWCEIIIHEGNAPHQTRNNTKEKPTHNLLYMYTAIISLSTTT